MKQKKTKIKIKRSKLNLYSKKKSKSRQTLSLVITIVAACVLGVVGYGIGKPIMNYLQNRDSYTSDSSDPWTPPMSDVSDSSDTESSNNSSDTVSQPEDTPPEPINSDPRMYILPADAASSSASLNSALAAAKEAGYGIAVATLKDAGGYLYYKSDIESVRDSELIVGSLTAAQICDYITKAGLVPAARINTLMDSNTPRIIGGGYMIVDGGSWLDNYPENGGKRWFSPFDQTAIDYISSVAGELSEAGFDHIICVNTMYPYFHGVDINSYLSNLPLSDRAKRAEALWNVVDHAKAAAEENGAQLWVELSGSGLLAEEKSITDAELAVDLEKLKTVGLIVDYSTSGAVTDAYQTAGDFAESLKSAVKDTELAVLIKNGLSGAALSDTERAFAEAGLLYFTES